jgi:hypothetical protein
MTDTPADNDDIEITVSAEDREQFKRLIFPAPQLNDSLIAKIFQVKQLPLA